MKAVNPQNICLPAILMLLLGIYGSNLSCSAAAMKIWAPPFWQSGSSLIWNKAGMFVKVYLTVSNLAYVEKKARGRLTAPACLSTCFKMVSAFFRGEPLGYPWEGGCIKPAFKPAEQHWSAAASCPRKPLRNRTRTRTLRRS